MATIESSGCNPAFAAGLSGSTFAITGVSAGKISIWRNPLRVHGFVSGMIGRASTVFLSTRPSETRSIVIGIVSPSLRMTRHEILSSPMPPKRVTAFPSTANILSPAFKPACSAGDSGMTYPIVVVVSDSLTGRPTVQMITAKRTARPKLKSGPANATIILSSAEILGSFARSRSALPSIMSIGASCGSATKPPKGSEPREYCTPLIVFFQSGLPNQTPNFSIYKPRQRAAKKCPSSCTTMSRLKSTTTSITMRIIRPM